MPAGHAFEVSEPRAMLTNGNKSQGSGTLQVHLLCPDQELRDSARLAMEELPEFDLMIGLDSLKSTEPLTIDQADVIMAAMDDGACPAIELFSRQLGVAKRPVQIALIADVSAESIRRALRAGADEVLAIPLQKAELIKALLKISELHRRDDVARNCLVCAVTGPSGGIGITTVVANLALALRYALKCTVVAIDLDLQASDLTVQLNLEPEGTIVDAVTAAKLDSIQLDKILVKHSSGVYVLAAPKRIEEADKVSASSLTTTITLLQEMFDCVLVDCGRYIDDRSITMWEASDHLFYVVDQSIGAIRCAGRAIDLFSCLQTSAPSAELILNRFAQSGLISAAQITDTLGRPLYGQIPRHDKLFVSASEQGKNIWQIDSSAAVVRSFEQLAYKLTGRKQPDSRKRFLPRFLPTRSHISGDRP